MIEKKIITGVLLLMISALPAVDFNRAPDTSQSFPTVQGSGKKDVNVISNPKMPQPPDGKPVFMIFEEDLSIGVREGGENCMFGNRVYFNTDAGGNFYVTDWDRKRIQKYDPQGKYLLTIGRPGQGPGEFQNVWRPEFDNVGNLYVTDIAANRISFFDKVGLFLKQIKFPPGFSPTLVNSRGLLFGSQTLVEENPDKFTSIYGLFNDQFKTVADLQKTVWEPKRSSGSGEEAIVESLANNVSDQAFKANPFYLLGQDDFIWFGYPEKYEIRVYDPDGRLDRIIQREYDPRPITKKDKERFIAEQEIEFFRFLPARAKGLKNKVIDRIKFPKNKPAYNSFALMENGWLAVVIETADNGDTIFDLYDKNGRYIAHFQGPVPSEGLFFNNGMAYALKTEDDYKFIRRYRFEIR